LKKQLGDLQQSLGKRDPKPPEAVTTAVKAATDRAEALAKRMSRQEPLGFAGAPLEDDPDPLLARARGLYLAIGGLPPPPPPPPRPAPRGGARPGRRPPPEAQRPPPPSA